MLEPAFALPRVKALLEREEIWSLAIEAAAMLADMSLIPTLEALAEAWAGDNDPRFKQLLAEALRACRTGVPPKPSPD